MPIQLNPGIFREISFHDQAGKTLYSQKNMSKEDMDTIIKESKKSSVQGWGGLAAAFIVIRTDNWKDLAKDLLLPMFFNHTIKINSVAGRFFASIFAIFFDVITLIPRAVLAPFRVNYNYGKKVEANYLVQFLRYRETSETKASTEAAIQQGIITVRTREEEVTISPADDYKDTDRAVRNTRGAFFRVMIKELPGNQYQKGNYCSGSTYLRNKTTNQEWVIEHPPIVPEGSWELPKGSNEAIPKNYSSIQSGYSF